MKKQVKILSIAIVALCMLLIGISVKNYVEYKNDFIKVNGKVTWSLSNMELNIDNELESYMYYTFKEENKAVDANITVLKDSIILNSVKGRIEFKKVNDNIYSNNGINVYINEKEGQCNLFTNNTHTELFNTSDLAHELEKICFNK